MELKARQRSLWDCRVEDGLVVYDHERNEAHYLNRSAAVIWKHCDGQTNLAELAALLPDNCQLPADEEVVCLALKRLDSARLLQEPLSGNPRIVGVTRREVMQRLSLASALSIMLPAVTSVLIPTAAWAASDTEPGGSCNCQLDRQPPFPSPDCTDSNRGATATTTRGGGNCLGTAKNCSGTCTVTAMWKCGNDVRWELIDRSNDCPKPS